MKILDHVTKISPPDTTYMSPANTKAVSTKHPIINKTLFVVS